MLLRIPKRVIFALKPGSVELGELHRVPGKPVDVGGGGGGVAEVPAMRSSCTLTDNYTTNHPGKSVHPTKVKHTGKKKGHAPNANEFFIMVLS